MKISYILDILLHRELEHSLAFKILNVNPGVSLSQENLHNLKVRVDNSVMKRSIVFVVDAVHVGLVVLQENPRKHCIAFKHSQVQRSLDHVVVSYHVDIGEPCLHDQSQSLVLIGLYCCMQGAQSVSRVTIVNICGLFSRAKCIKQFLDLLEVSFCDGFNKFEVVLILFGPEVGPHSSYLRLFADGGELESLPFVKV